MDPVVARKTWRTLEPLHGVVYFAREREDACARLGLRSEQGYFVTRAAAMGAVGADVVIATFFNFHPAFVRRAMDDAWQRTTPAAAVSARLDAVRAMLARILGSPGGLDDAVSLARRAAERAAERPEGRPLFAGHASLPWPDAGDEPLVALWHAQTLLREFRGDGHVAAMTAEGIDGCEALVVHAATGDVSRRALQSSRQWSDDEWSAATDRLRSRGWLDADGALTDAGRASRAWVEDRTDALAVAAYEPLGDDGCERLRALCRPLSQAIVASGELSL